MSDKPKCPECGGSGKVPTPPDQTGVFYVPCPDCQAKAEKEVKPCEGEFVKNAEYYLKYKRIDISPSSVDKKEFVHENKNLYQLLVQAIGFLKASKGEVKELKLALRIIANTKTEEGVKDLPFLASQVLQALESQTLKGE